MDGNYCVKNCKNDEIFDIINDAYGKLQVTRLAGKKLPFPGGFDKDGNVTDDPGAIEESMRIMPMGYWKGSAFAFMLDILGSVLSDGVGAVDMNAATRGSCGGCSQIMIVIDPKKTMDGRKMEETIRRAAGYIKSTTERSSSSAR